MAPSLVKYVSLHSMILSWYLKLSAVDHVLVLKVAAPLSLLLYESVTMYSLSFLYQLPSSMLGGPLESLYDKKTKQSQSRVRSSALSSTNYAKPMDAVGHTVQVDENFTELDGSEEKVSRLSSSTSVRFSEVEIFEAQEMTTLQSGTIGDVVLDYTLAEENEEPLPGPMPQDDDYPDRVCTCC